MDTQNREQISTGAREKFPEPRGWAMKWVLTQETARSTAEQGPKDGDRTWKKFAEPQGWALKWDGFALLRLGSSRAGVPLLPPLNPAEMGS